MWSIKQTRTQPLTDQGGNVIYPKFNIWGPCRFKNYTPNYGSAIWIPVYDAFGSIYKDNYSKSCAAPSEDRPTYCYNPVIRKIQNRKGCVDEAYIYTTDNYVPQIANSCKIYKKNNGKFNQQGAVSGGSRINRLKYQTTLKAQSRIINGKTNTINGRLPATLYKKSNPRGKNIYNCWLNSGRTCNGLLQKCKIINSKCSNI